MENKTLNEFALMCECAQSAATIGILTDFLKKAVTDFYSHKSNKTEFKQEEMEVFRKKYEEFQGLLKEII